MPSWLSDTRPIASLQVEVCFLIQERLYYGPDRFSDPADLQTLAEPLAPPALPMQDAGLVRSAEALGYERALADHYRQIVRLARQHRLPFNSIRHYFWLRLWLWNPEQRVGIAFPWYDSFAEIDGFLRPLIDIADGPVHDDADQGWALQTHTQDGTLYFLQSDPDEDTTQVAIATPRAALVAQVAELRERMHAILARLRDELGADVWSAYVRDEPTFKA